MTRDEIFARDGYRCVYCGREFPAGELTIDHVQARSRGGDRSGGNLVSACGGCNVRKGRRRLSNFLADEPETLAMFRHLAVHVWPRHLRHLELEVAQSLARNAGRRRSPGNA